ncbi:MAG: hypothetical protein CMJ94_11665 [Planctomycetes bacterium]|nr:hypothetical protein [Planctomycetota bacterium]
MSCRRRWALGGIALALGGCASVNPEPDYGRARDEVARATGFATLYQPNEEERCREQVAELLEGGLTSHEAVQVALLNHPRLRELMFEIGSSRADAVQAGLLSNPSLGLLVRFPVDGGSVVTEGGVMQNLSELWQMPIRKQIAEGQVEHAILALGQNAVLVAAQTKSAYSSALATASALTVAEENLGTAQRFLDLTGERVAAGAATQVDLNAARSTMLEQLAHVRAARFRAGEAKRNLVLVLGLATPPERIELSDRLSDSDHGTLELERLLTVASENRLDLRAVKQEVLALEQSVPLERRRVWRFVGGGLDFEVEGGEVSLGPALELELPIFDQNQAQVAKAELRYLKALERLDGVTTAVSQQVRGAYERFLLAQDMADLYRAELLPLREESLNLAMESFAAGKTGFLSVLEAQERLLQTRQEFVDQLEAVALSIPALEAACGRPFDFLLEAEE